MGGYEPNPRPWAEAGIPDGFALHTARRRLDHFEPIMRLALGRVPALETAGIKQFINGPESFTPDGNFILGEAPEVAGIFVGAGFNAFGIASGGGAGMALAEWVANGAPPYDLWPVDIRRFGRNHLATRLGPHPHARGLRPALRHGLAARGIRLWPPAPPLAALRPPAGPRRLSSARSSAGSAPTGSPPPARRPEDVPTFGRPNWHAAVAREHRACREAAALFDQTSFAKFMLTGRDAEAALSWIAANDVARPPGSARLHPDAERARRHRMRPDRRPPRRGRLLHRHRHRLRHPRRRLDPPQHPRRPRRPPRRRHAAARRPRPDGPPRPRHPRPPHRRGHHQRRLPLRHRPPPLASPARRSSPFASPTSASSAGNCTSPSNSPPPSTTPS